MSFSSKLTGFMKGASSSKKARAGNSGSSKRKRSGDNDNNSEGSSSSGGANARAAGDGAAAAPTLLRAGAVPRPGGPPPGAGFGGAFAQPRPPPPPPPPSSSSSASSSSSTAFAPSTSESHSLAANAARPPAHLADGVNRVVTPYQGALGLRLNFNYWGANFGPLAPRDIQDLMVSSLADAPTGKCNEALEWVESRDNARHAQKAFSCSAGTNSSSSSSSRSGNGDGGNGEGGSNNKRQCPVMVLVTASVRPDALLRSFDRSSTSDKKSVINDGSGGGPSDSSSSSDSSEGDQGVRFLRACSSVPLFHAAEPRPPVKDMNTSRNTAWPPPVKPGEAHCLRKALLWRPPPSLPLSSAHLMPLPELFTDHVLVFDVEHQFWGGTVTFRTSTNDTKNGATATSATQDGDAGSKEGFSSSETVETANSGMVELSGKITQSPTQTIGEWHLELHPSPISTSPTEANSSSMTTSLTAIPSEPTPPPAALHTPHHPNSAWVKGELRVCWLTRDTWPDETFTLQPGPFPNDAASAALGSGSGKQAAGVEHTQEWHFLGSSTSFGRTMAMSLKTATPIPPHSPPPAADAPLPATAQPPAPESTPVLSPGAAATSSCSTAASHVEHGCAVPPVSLELSLQQREALNIPIDAPSEGYKCTDGWIAETKDTTKVDDDEEEEGEMEEEGEAEGDEGGGVRKEEEEEEIGENGEDGEEFSNSQRKRPRLDGVPSFVNAEAVSAISAAAASAITSDAAAPAPVIAKESLLPFALRAAVEDTWVGVDCEMCNTAEGLEITRATFVSSHGTVLYDSLIKPPRPIVNYNTEFSGITQAMMEKGPTPSLHEVHRQLQRRGIVNGTTTVLVGHSIDSDLRALKLVHRRVIDTAALYPHPKGAPFKQSLKGLAKEHLHESIQDQGLDGHDSFEDARVAMDLALLKLSKGHAYGVPTSGRLPRVLPLLPLPPSSAPSSDASAGSGGNGNNSNSTAASDDISSPVWERIPASSASSSTEGAEPVLTVKVYSCDHDISAHHEPLAAEVTSSLQPLWARFNTGFRDDEDPHSVALSAMTNDSANAEGGAANEEPSENMKWRVHAHQQQHLCESSGARPSSSSSSMTATRPTTAFPSTLAEVQAAIADASRSSVSKDEGGGPTLIWVDLPASSSGANGQEGSEQSISEVGNTCLQLWQALPQGGILTCATQAPLEPLRAASARKQAAKWNARTVAEKRHLAGGRAGRQEWKEGDDAALMYATDEAAAGVAFLATKQ